MGLTTTGVVGWSLTLLLAATLGVVLVRHRTISARAQRLAAAQAEVVEQHRTLLAMGTDGVLVHAVDGSLLEMNPVAVGMLGGRPGHGQRIDELPVTFVNAYGHPMNPRALFGAPRSGPVPRTVDEGPVGIVQVAGPTAPPDVPPQVRWVRVATRRAHGDVLVTVLSDVARAAQGHGAVSMQAALDHAPGGLVLLDFRWRIQDANAAFGHLVGIGPPALRGAGLLDLVHPEDREAVRARAHGVLEGTEARCSVENRLVHADGSVAWTVLEIAAVRAGDGPPRQLVAQVQDITDSRMQAEMLTHRAMHDPLTGLANRALLQEVLQKALEQPGAADRLAVVAVDLDEFKPINDRFGHAAGDAVLVHVAGVLRAAVAGRGTVARLGGDEFVVVLPDGDDPQTVFDVAAGVHAGLRRSLRVQRHEVTVRASVGIALATPELTAKGAPGLLAAADAALYRAKARGRSRTEVYEPSMQVGDPAYVGLAAELPDALAAGALLLHYQPLVDLRTGQVAGYEAFVRWQHPEHGLLAPEVVLPTAEEAGMSAALGAYVVAEAVRFLSRHVKSTWRVSVNASANQLGDGELAARAVHELSRWAVAPDRLMVELTAATLVEPNTRIRHELTELRQVGVQVLLDDFGTRASPLTYLRELPVSGVKLDRSFTSGVLTDPDAARVSRGLGVLARELGLITVAEGIEDREQAVRLGSYGWQYGQGWLFGPAQPEPGLT